MEGKYCFISYCTKNTDLAEKLQKELDGANISTWMAPKSIKEGEDYSNVIVKAVRDCSCFVLVLTQESQNSFYVQRELDRAVYYGKPIIALQHGNFNLNNSFQFYLCVTQIAPVSNPSVDYLNCCARVKSIIQKGGSSSEVNDNYIEKIERLKKHPSEAKDDYEFYMLLSLYEESGEWSNAITYAYNSLLKKYPENLELHVDRAVCYLKLRKFKEALEDVKFAWNKDPEGIGYKTLYDKILEESPLHFKIIHDKFKFFLTGMLTIILCMVGFISCNLDNHRISDYINSFWREEVVLSDSMYKTNAEQLLKAATDGSKDAQYVLGCLYYDGTSGFAIKDDSRAFKWWKKAAEQENTDAQYNLAMAYIDGIGCDKNAKEAVSWLTKAATEGHREAQCLLGYAHKVGFGTEKDYKKAFYWFNKAGEQNSPTALYYLSQAYFLGEGVEKDIRKSTVVLCGAAFYGSEKALDDVSKMSGDISLESTFDMYMKAALEGDKYAQYEVAEAFIFGRGVSKSKEDGIKWHLNAAQNGYVESQLALGGIYGALEKYDDSVKWYNTAAKNGNKEAQYVLGRYYFESEKNLSKAFQFFKEAAENDQADAQMELVGLYTKGEGVRENLSEAFEWCKRAAVGNNNEAKLVLGKLYFVGEGTEKNVKEAFRWWVEFFKSKDDDTGCDDDLGYIGNIVESIEDYEEKDKSKVSKLPSDDKQITKEMDKIIKLVDKEISTVRADMNKKRILSGKYCL